MTASLRTATTVLNILDPGTDAASRRLSNTSVASHASFVQPEEDNFSGTYEFERYDENLEDYLDSLGLPSKDLGDIVRQAKVKIELKMPQAPDTKWTLITSELDGDEEHSTTIIYELDKEYTNYNKNNDTTETTVCTKEDNFTLVYKSQVPHQSWKVENSAVFTPDGIVSTLKNLNMTNMTTTKYYKKISN